MRRLPTAGAVTALLGLVLLLLGAPAGAQTDDEPVGADPADGRPSTIIDVVEVEGLLDPVTVDFLLRAIDEAERAAGDGVVGLVLQVDATGSVVSTDELVGLVERIASAEVPVSVWVGPSGSDATHEAALLGGAAASFGMAPGSSWGLDGAQVPTPAGRRCPSGGARRPHRGRGGRPSLA